MEITIDQIDGCRFSGEFHWRELRNSKTILNGYLRDNKVYFTEPVLTQGSMIVLNGTYVSSFVGNSFEKLQGAWYAQGARRESGKFTLHKEQMPRVNNKPVITESTISGQTFNKLTLEPVKTTLTIVGNKSPKQKTLTNNEGIYNYRTPINDLIIISINEIGYEPLEETISIDKANLTKVFFLTPKSIAIQPAKEKGPKYNNPVILNNVFFELTTAILLPESFSELDKLANRMQSNPTMKIRLDGHTDRIGDATSNLKLSQDRVAEVKRYLISRGINEKRITTKGFGDTKIVCRPPCDANRRVEFVVTEE